MSNYKIELLPAAWEDIQDIVDYIIVDNPQAAEKTIEKIMKSLRQLEQFPNAGMIAPYTEIEINPFRMLICSPYIAFYRVIENTIFIYHIIHGSRNYKDLFGKYI